MRNTTKTNAMYGLNMRRMAGGLAAGLLTLMSAGCIPGTDNAGSMSGDSSDTSGSSTSGTTTGSQTGTETGGTTTGGGSTSTDPNSTTGSTTTTDPNTTTSSSTPIVANSNSITQAPGGTRTDPEGVAASEAVTNLTWKDARGASRTMALGSYLHQYDFSFDDGKQVVQRSANDDAWGHEGFGYVVSHSVTGNSPLGKSNAPTKVETTIFTGGHHALHHVELTYDRDKEAGGYGIKIPVVIEWMVATGRDHPVWSVTWKMGTATNPSSKDFTTTYAMDVRGPYGSLNWDGAASRGAGDAIGGVAWGDYLYRFLSNGPELNLNSTWTYNTGNFVNFDRAWTENVNAEMGIVQTKGLDVSFPRGDRVAYSERGFTSADAYPGKGDCKSFGADARVYTMPCVDAWPYQMMNYDWENPAKPITEGTGTKLMAWGSNYGWLGGTTYKAFDGGSTLDGRGDRAYATFIVLGPKARYSAGSGMYDQPGDVMTMVSEVEALSLATITNVGPGSVAMQAPKGPGASENKTLVNGYNDTYAAFYLNAVGDQVKFTLTPDVGAKIETPVFVIENFTSRSIPAILVNGAAVTVNTGTADAGAFVSINEAGNELWVTVNREITAATTVEIKAQ